MTPDERRVVAYIATIPTPTGDSITSSVRTEVIEAARRALAAEGEPPAWAQVLLDALFTGARLDFKNIEIPLWLARRLEAEYGMPVPDGTPVDRSGPVDLDDEAPGTVTPGWPEPSDAP